MGLKLPPGNTDVKLPHHLALASFHRCDMLATWNCNHLANPGKLPHLRLINGPLGLVTPQLITPFELLETTP